MSFLCCGNQSGSTQLSILQNPQKCKIHSLQTKYICLEDDEKCMAQSLLCVKCLESHKSHNWKSLQQYFTKQFRSSLAKGTSLHGEKVQTLSTNVKKEIEKMKDIIQSKLDDFTVDITMTMEDLKAIYPVERKFGLGDGYGFLNNKNIKGFRQVCQRQKNGQWVSAASDFLLKLIKEAALMMGNFLDDFHAHLANRDFPLFTKETGKELADRFMKKYQGIFTEDTRFFKFSTDERHANIRINQERRQARFVKSAPSKPAAMTVKAMNKRHEKIYFQVGRLDKTLLVFDKQLIVVGVCLPNTVKTYGYRAVMQPSHGGFGIGSNGRVYHSTLYKYEKADIGFTYGQQDIVEVRLDYEANKVCFNKITGVFKKNFQMELQLPDDQMEELKPFVMFDGEEGAIVKILEQYETTSRYQRKNKKTQRQLEKKK